jgi:hypothetical protein
MISSQTPRKNHLLDALTKFDLSRFSEDLELVEMPLGQVLYESGEKLKHVYFPTTSIISLLYVMENGSSAEITANGGIGGAGGLGGNASLTTGANTLSTGASTSQGGSVGDLSTGASTSTVGNLTTGSSTSQGGSVGNLTTTSQGGSVGDLSTGSSTSQGGTSTAQGGSSSSSGNTSGNATITTNYIAAKIPVSSAYAPANYPTATCMGSSSLGATGALFGFSSGSTWEAPECMKLEMARSFAQAGMLEDALAIRCTSKYAAAAPSCIALQKNNN